jgi:cytoskeletal protein CcmA (bactofilin family)
MAIFNRSKRPDDDGELATLDRDELDLAAKAASRSGAAAPDGSGVALDEHEPAEWRPEPAALEDTNPMERPTVADTARPSDMTRRLVEAPRNDSELRKLTVGREISLQGEITNCDQLIVEGSVTANLTCQEVTIMDSGVLKGAVELGSVEVRGLFEGTLSVSGRLLIRSTGRVVGKVRYGQIEIEIGGQVSGELEAQPAAKGINRNGIAVGAFASAAA